MAIILLHLVTFVAVSVAVYSFLRGRTLQQQADAKVEKATKLMFHINKVAAESMKYPSYTHATLLDRFAERLYVRLVLESNRSPAAVKAAAIEAYRLAEQLVIIREDWRNA